MARSETTIFSDATSLPGETAWLGNNNAVELGEPGRGVHPPGIQSLRPDPLWLLDRERACTMRPLQETGLCQSDCIRF